MTLGTFLKWTRSSKERIARHYAAEEWNQAVLSYLAISLDRLADRSATLCTWDQGYTKVNHVFHRYALPITWDFCEGNVLSNTTGNYGDAVGWAAKYVEHALDACSHTTAPNVIQQSATVFHRNSFADVIVTDPPYYDAILYSDLMDFFYVWLRRSVGDLSPDLKHSLTH
jgi:putative DNA methylase